MLVIISQADGSLALNLKAPLVIHLAERLGRQIVARDDHAVQHRLHGQRRCERRLKADRSGFAESAATEVLPTSATDSD